MKHFSSTNVPQGWNLKDSQQRYQVVFMNLEPGASWPKESHPGMDQLFFVVSGTGKAMSGTRSVTLRSGDALTIPAGTEHEVAALEKGMKLWTVYTPVKPGVFQHDNDPTLKDELRAALVDAPLEFQSTVQSLLHRMEAHDAGIQRDEHAYLLEGAAKEWIELIGRRTGGSRRRRSRSRKSRSRSRGGRRRSKSRSPKKQGKSKSRSRSRGRRQSKSRSPTKGGARQRKSKSRGRRQSKSGSPTKSGAKKQGKSKSRSRSRGRRQSKSRSRSRRERRRQQRRSQSPSTGRFDTFGPNSSWGTSTDGAPRLYSTTYAPASTGSPRLYPSAVSPTTVSPPTSPRPTRPVPLPPVSPTISPPTSPRPTRPVPQPPTTFRSSSNTVVDNSARYTDGGRATRIEVE